MPDKPLIHIPTKQEIGEFTTTIKTFPDRIYQVLDRLLPNAQDMLDGGMNLKEVVERAILHCFAEELEGVDVEHLRYQYKHFLTMGDFDLSRKIHWTCHEVLGTEIYLVPVELDIPKDVVGIAKLSVNENLITDRDGLKGGERVIFKGMWGWVWGTVMVNDDGTPYVKGEDTMYTLGYSENRFPGIPPCWTMGVSINLKGLERLTLMRGPDPETPGLEPAPSE